MNFHEDLPESAAEARQRLTLPVRVYYEDTDCLGIVYHSNYLKYFERGREQLLGEDDLVDLFENDNKKNFVVASVEVKFKKPSKHGDDLIVRTIPTRDGSYKLNLEQTIWRKERLKNCSGKTQSTSASDDEDEAQQSTGGQPKGSELVPMPSVTANNSDKALSDTGRYTLLVQAMVTMCCVEGENMSLCALPDRICGPLEHLMSSVELSLDPPAKPKRMLPLPKKTKDSEVAWSSVFPSQLIEVYYEDTDFTKVVYYANYLKYMERARSQLFGLRNLARLQKEHHVSFVVYSADLAFKQSAHHADLLVVKTRYRVDGAFSLVFEQDIYRRGNLCDSSSASGGNSSEEETGGDEKHKDILLVKGKVTLVALGDPDNSLVKIDEVLTKAGFQIDGGDSSVISR